MQIQLKQSEIEAAIKGYLSRMGIPIAGRKISISFVAGRQERGLSADMSIEDLDLPPDAYEEVPPAPPETEAPASEDSPAPAKKVAVKAKLLAGLAAGPGVKEEPDEEAVTPRMAMMDKSIFR